MSTKIHRLLRILVMVTLFLLLVQYELGMSVNLGPPLPKLPAFALAATPFRDALYAAGVTAIAHASLGSLLAVISLVNLVAAQFTGKTSVRVFGILAFLTTLLAAGLGVAFVLSGFQNDGLSHGMATNFILTFTFYFLELFALRQGGRPQEASKVNAKESQ